MAGKVQRQFFGAGNDETQTAKLMWFGLAKVHAQKSGSRQKERKFVLLDQRCVFRRFQWIRIGDNSHTLDERVPKCDGRSKGVKERQGCEDGVALACIQQLSKL